MEKHVADGSRCWELGTLELRHRQHGWYTAHINMQQDRMSRSDGRLVRSYK